jgi:hypothetical protein
MVHISKYVRSGLYPCNFHDLFPFFRQPRLLAGRCLAGLRVKGARIMDSRFSGHDASLELMQASPQSALLWLCARTNPMVDPRGFAQRVSLILEKRYV